jgi:hypothetical protein
MSKVIVRGLFSISIQFISYAITIANIVPNLFLSVTNFWDISTPHLSEVLNVIAKTMPNFPKTLRSA